MLERQIQNKSIFLVVIVSCYFVSICLCVLSCIYSLYHVPIHLKYNVSENAIQCHITFHFSYHIIFVRLFLSSRFVIILFYHMILVTLVFCFFLIFLSYLVVFWINVSKWQKTMNKIKTCLNQLNWNKHNKDTDKNHTNKCPTLIKHNKQK